MKSYNENESSKHITYLDANNLYGWAMSLYLPTRVFRWLTRNKIKKRDVNTIQKDKTDDCIVEFDLDYPEELHNLHNDYPLAPEKSEIKESILPDYYREIASMYNILIGKDKKLAPNLSNKNKHVFHYIQLQLYLQLGIKITKFGLLLTFKNHNG